MVFLNCSCGAHSTIDSKYIGQKVRCKKCKNVLVVGEQPQPPPEVIHIDEWLKNIQQEEDLNTTEPECNVRQVELSDYYAPKRNYGPFLSFSIGFVLIALVFFGCCVFYKYQPEVAATIGYIIGMLVFFGAITIGGLFIYFLPSIFAFKENHHNANAIFVLNLLFGWCFLGWAAALIWCQTKPPPK